MVTPQESCCLKAQKRNPHRRRQRIRLQAATASSTPIIIPERAALDLVVDRVEPEYPNEAKAHHVQGSVVLDLLVGRDGRVERLSRVQGDLGLTASATDAVRQWRFKPVIRNGRPAGFETQITLTFALP